MKKNMLYIFADQWGAWAVGENNSQIKTPYIDEFSKDSISFENATSTCPLCSPYRATLFTGKYPVATGVYGNCMSGYNIALNENERCFSDILWDCGYDTGYIGKWHLDEPEKNNCKKPVSGAENWDAYTPPGKKRHSFRYWHSYGACDRHLSQHYWENSPEKIMADKWSPEHETDKAIEFIKGQRDKPFALFIAWNPPHPPFNLVPKKYKDIYDKIELDKTYDGKETTNHTLEQGSISKDELENKAKEYFGAITGIDEQFGRLIDFLKQEGIYDDTLIVLTSDHGEHLGSHNLVGKHTWYEQSVNVPLYIRLPDVVSANKTDVCMDTVNLMPTLCAMLDIEDDAVNKKNDLLPFIKGEEKRADDYSFLSAYISRDVFIEACKKVDIMPQDMGWRALRDKTHTYVIFRGYTPEYKPRFILYDRKKDELQVEPMISDLPPTNGVAKTMHNILMEHLKIENINFYNWVNCVHTLINKNQVLA